VISKSRKSVHTQGEAIAYMRLLLIDNYDSFTFNLAQLIASTTGVFPDIVKNDEISISGVMDKAVDAIILSPGPGRPDRPRDFGICREILINMSVPTLGVCLGHQGIGHFFGGTVCHAPDVVHGRVDQIYHGGHSLFQNIPQGFESVRYHSLILSQLGPELKKIAWTDDGLIMGIAHLHRPLYGVQFHPESIASTFGTQLIENFLKITYDKVFPKEERSPLNAAGSALINRRPLRSTGGPEAMNVHVATLERGPDPETAFMTLFAGSAWAFWLDSHSDHQDLARFSFMGDGRGPRAERLTACVDEGGVTSILGDRKQDYPGSVFEVLERLLTERRSCPPPGYPLPFCGGWIGWFGYELMVQTGGPAGYKAETPDACFLFVDQFLGYDKTTGRWWLVYVGGEETDAQDYFATITTKLKAAQRPPEPEPIQGLVFKPSLEVPRYRNAILSAKDFIREGETYEVCLTNAFTAKADIDPVQAYRCLRRTARFPFGAFLMFGDVAVLSSSPERFLQITVDGNIEAKPIKGTIRRGDTVEEDQNLARTLSDSVKDRAENLMIADLLRNDLGKVCEIGTVDVPVLFGIESFSAVHQMVTTVRGRLRDSVSPIACLHAAFPGGSMTGAPKRRTLEIINTLEQRPRGIYSGAIGYISLDGAIDLSIVIRTAVLHNGHISIGAGGAITDLSDPDAEIEEVALKCQSILKVFGGHIS